jgi:hypothetical protein
LEAMRLMHMNIHVHYLPTNKMLGYFINKISHCITQYCL